MRLPPPPLPPPPSPPPPGPFAAARGERGGAAGAAMEPDSVIEDKTIELMVSAALWTVCSSVRPAPGGPAHLSVRREAGPGPSRPSRPRPGPPAFRGLGPGAAPPDPSISQAGPGPAPSMPLGSPPCPRPVSGPISRTTLACLRYGLSPHSLQHLILLFLEWDLLLFFLYFSGPGLRRS